jgi:hypothetical protein
MYAADAIWCPQTHNKTIVEPGPDGPRFVNFSAKRVRHFTGRDVKLEEQNDREHLFSVG